jgi:hypothetical protein
MSEGVEGKEVVGGCQGVDWGVDSTCGLVSRIGDGDVDKTFEDEM